MLVIQLTGSTGAGTLSVTPITAQQISGRFDDVSVAGLRSCETAAVSVAYSPNCVCQSGRRLNLQEEELAADPRARRRALYRSAGVHHSHRCFHRQAKEQKDVE